MNTQVIIIYPTSMPLWIDLWAICELDKLLPEFQFYPILSNYRFTRV